jgi:hypothetical protein
MAQIHGKFQVALRLKETNRIIAAMQNLSQQKPLHVAARFFASGTLQLWFMYYFTHGGAVGIGGQFSDTAKEFLFVFLPTIAILFLVPVIIWGSRLQKILAVILSLSPAWFAFQSWSEIVIDHILN